MIQKKCFSKKSFEGLQYARGGWKCKSFAILMGKIGAYSQYRFLAGAVKSVLYLTDFGLKIRSNTIHKTLFEIFKLYLVSRALNDLIPFTMAKFLALYLPFHTGLRFSAKAAMPSAASSVCTALPSMLFRKS